MVVECLSGVKHSEFNVLLSDQGFFVITLISVSLRSFEG